MVTTLDQWGHAYLRQQKFAAAQAAFAEGLALAQTMNTRHLMGEALYGLAQTALATGDQAEAKRLGQASLALFTEIRYQRTDEVRAWLVRCNLLEEGRQDGGKSDIVRNVTLSVTIPRRSPATLRAQNQFCRFFMEEGDQNDRALWCDINQAN